MMLWAFFSGFVNVPRGKKSMHGWAALSATRPSVAMCSWFQVFPSAMDVRLPQPVILLPCLGSEAGTNASDLIAIVPPGHHPGIRGRIRLKCPHEYITRQAFIHL